MDDAVEVMTERSRATVRYYGDVVRALRKAVEARGEVWSGQAAVDEIARRKLGLASQTAYLSGIRFIHRGDAAFLTGFEDAVPGLPQGATRVRDPHPVLSPEKVGLVLEAIRRRQTRREGMNERVAALIVATRLFGLRPAEWASARWADDTKSVLQVGNAKFARLKVESGPFAGRTWKRGNGKIREIGLPDKDRESYQRAADAAMAGEQKFPWVENKQVIGFIHRDTLRGLAADGVVSERMAEQLKIYSYRHSFAANAKFTLDLFAGEVAALMGHISITTATRSYAPRRKATASVRVRPTNESVEKVVNRNSAVAKVIARENEPDLFDDLDADLAEIKPVQKSKAAYDKKP